jgi:anti-sigma factor RsiW
VSTDKSGQGGQSRGAGCGAVSTEELEALLQGALPVEQRTVIAAHTESCAQCLKELTWLRTESGLFAERAKRTPVPQLWTQVEQQLARPSVQPSRGRWAMGTQTKQWLAVGAAAAAMVMMSLGAFSPLRLRDSAVDWLRKPFAGASGVDSKHHAAAASDAADSEADESDSHSASSVEGTAKLTGSVTVSVTTLAADVQVHVGGPGEAKLQVEDGEIKAVRLVEEKPGRLRAEFDGSTSLREGTVTLTLPPGSQVELTSTSGDLSVVELRGDVTVSTTSGEVMLNGVREAKVTTTSGDSVIDRVTGAVEVHSTSGSVHLTGDVQSPVRFESTSGDFMLDGACKAGCNLTARTTSGELSIHAKKQAPCVVKLRSLSGELSGAQDLPVEMKRLPGQKSEWTAYIGRTAADRVASGSIELESVSGDLNLLPAE